MMQLITLPLSEIRWLVRFHTAVSALQMENPALDRLIEDEYNNIDPEMREDMWDQYLTAVHHRISTVIGVTNGR